MTERAERCDQRGIGRTQSQTTSAGEFTPAKTPT